MSELSLQSDVYAPVVNDTGEYCDYVPMIMSQGLTCPCTNRVYLRKANFRLHIQNDCHIGWLKRVNENRHNYYAENTRLAELVKQQQRLLVEKEASIAAKNSLIADLTGRLMVASSVPTIDFIN